MNTTLKTQPATFEDIDPATGEVIATVEITSAANVEATVARAQAVGAPLHFVRDRFPQGLPEVSLPGEHQRRNAGAALLACELATRLPIDDAKACAALLTVEWAGRWQSHRLADGRRLIVDGSHNEEGARVVEPLLASLASPTVIVGALGEIPGAALACEGALVLRGIDRGGVTTALICHVHQGDKVRSRG